jgi:hypothetical protein
MLRFTLSILKTIKAEHFADSISTSFSGKICTYVDHVREGRSNSFCLFLFLRMEMPSLKSCCCLSYVHV